jgi:hypothetical protein
MHSEHNDWNIYCKPTLTEPPPYIVAREFHYPLYCIFFLYKAFFL